MHHILDRLEADHQRTLRLLYLIDTEISRLTGTAPGLANTEKILDIFDYLQVYPEAWHHPVEGIVLQHYMERLAHETSNNGAHNNTGSELQIQRVKRLLNEHFQLDTLSKEVTSCFTDIHLGNSQSTPLFQRLFKKFHNNQIRHICAERKVFEDADQRFTPTDWQQIESTIKATISEDILEQRRFYSEHAGNLGMDNILTASPALASQQ